MERKWERGFTLFHSRTTGIEGILVFFFFLFVYLHSFFFLLRFLVSRYLSPHARMIASNSVVSILSCGRGGRWEGRLDDEETGSAHRCIKT